MRGRERTLVLPPALELLDRQLALSPRRLEKVAERCVEIDGAALGERLELVDREPAEKGRAGGGGVKREDAAGVGSELPEVVTDECLHALGAQPVSEH